MAPHRDAHWPLHAANTDTSSRTSLLVSQPARTASNIAHSKARIDVVRINRPHGAVSIPLTDSHPLLVQCTTYSATSLEGSCICDCHLGTRNSLQNRLLVVKYALPMTLLVRVAFNARHVYARWCNERHMECNPQWWLGHTNTPHSR